MLPYLMICVSVVFEVFGDTMMKVSNGFQTASCPLSA